MTNIKNLGKMPSKERKEKYQAIMHFT